MRDFGGSRSRRGVLPLAATAPLLLLLLLLLNPADFSSDSSASFAAAHAHGHEEPKKSKEGKNFEPHPDFGTLRSVDCECPGSDEMTDGTIDKDGGHCPDGCSIVGMSAVGTPAFQAPPMSLSLCPCGDYSTAFEMLNSPCPEGDLSEYCPGEIPLIMEPPKAESENFEPHPENGDRLTDVGCQCPNGETTDGWIDDEGAHCPEGCDIITLAAIGQPPPPPPLTTEEPKKSKEGKNFEPHPEFGTLRTIECECPGSDEITRGTIDKEGGRCDPGCVIVGKSAVGTSVYQTPTPPMLASYISLCPCGDGTVFEMLNSPCPEGDLSEYCPGEISLIVEPPPTTEEPKESKEGKNFEPHPEFGHLVGVECECLGMEETTDGTIDDKGGHCPDGCSIAGMSAVGVPVYQTPTPPMLVSLSLCPCGDYSTAFEMLNSPCPEGDLSEYCPGEISLIMEPPPTTEEPKESKEGKNFEPHPEFGTLRTIDCECLGSDEITRGMIDKDGGRCPDGCSIVGKSVVGTPAFQTPTPPMLASYISLCPCGDYLTAFQMLNSPCPEDDLSKYCPGDIDMPIAAPMATVGDPPPKSSMSEGHNFEPHPKSGDRLTGVGCQCPNGGSYERIDGWIDDEGAHCDPGCDIIELALLGPPPSPPPPSEIVETVEVPPPQFEDVSVEPMFVDMPDQIDLEMAIPDEERCCTYDDDCVADPDRPYLGDCGYYYCDTYLNVCVFNAHEDKDEDCLDAYFVTCDWDHSMCDRGPAGSVGGCVGYDANECVYHWCPTGVKVPDRPTAPPPPEGMCCSSRAHCMADPGKPDLHDCGTVWCDEYTGMCMFDAHEDKLDMCLDEYFVTCGGDSDMCDRGPDGSIGACVGYEYDGEYNECVYSWCPTGAMEVVPPPEPPHDHPDDYSDEEEYPDDYPEEDHDHEEGHCTEENADTVCDSGKTNLAACGDISCEEGLCLFNAWNEDCLKYYVNCEGDDNACNKNPYGSVGTCTGWNHTECEYRWYPMM